MADTRSIPLLTSEAATGQPVTLSKGGRYVWSVVGTFGGAVTTLQSIGPDGTTWQDVASMSTSGQLSIFAGASESLRVAVTGGSPSALYSKLAEVF